MDTEAVTTVLEYPDPIFVLETGVVARPTVSIEFTVTFADVDPTVMDTDDKLLLVELDHVPTSETKDGDKTLIFVFVQ